MSPIRLGAPLRRAGRIGLPLVSATALLAALAAPAGAASVSRTFSTPGCGPALFTVPDGVTSLDVVAQGGHGAASGTGVPGGYGVQVSGTIAVTPGSSPMICVGSGGGAVAAPPQGGGAGGGLSGIALSMDMATADLIAAGGGGGGGGTGSGALALRAGGNGGLLTEGGSSGGNSSFSEGGGGGSLLSGGNGGFSSGGQLGARGIRLGGGAAYAGGFGAGGGGGGGAGYFGGGGGGGGDGDVDVAGGGGGGGASYCAGDLLCTSSVVGSNPYVQLSYEVAPTPTTTTVTVDPLTPIAGDQVRVTATIAPAPTSGTVDFDRAGEAIAACDDVAVVDGTATCDLWIPTSEYASQSVRASFSGSDDFVASNGSTSFDPLAALVAIDPAPVAFGDVVVGVAATRVVTVRNDGDAPLEINESNGIMIYDQPPGFSAGGVSTRAVLRNETDYTVASTDCSGAVLDTGESCSVTVSFTPRALGARPGTLWVHSNANNDDEDTVPLTGAGVDAPPVDPDPIPDPPASVDPARVDPARVDPPIAAPVTPPAPTPPAAPVPVANPVPAPRGAVFSPDAPTSLVVATGGGVSVPLKCPAGGTCRVDGTLSLTVAGGAKVRASAAAAKTTVLVRFSGIRVAANKTKTLSLRLPLAFVKRQQAKGVRKLRTTLTLKTTTGDGSTVTTRKQVTLLIPRASVAQRRAAVAEPKPAQRPSFTG